MRGRMMELCLLGLMLIVFPSPCFMSISDRDCRDRMINIVDGFRNEYEGKWFGFYLLYVL